MATVSSLGVGSGIDLQALVDGFISAESQSRLIPLDRQEAAATAKISAYGALKSAISTFNSSINSLGSASTFEARRATSSDNESLTISTSPNASIASYQVDVVSVGTAQRLTGSSLLDATGSALADVNTAIGGGELTIQQGSQTAFTVEIDPTASSLTDIANAINNAEGNTGVEASVITADAGPTLVIQASEVGADNAISISVDDIDENDTDTQGLSQLSFDGVDDNLTESVGAGNASITVNGQAATSTSGNSFDSIVEGVTFNALQVTTETVTASVSKNTSASVTAAEGFVTAYNELIDSVNQLTSVSGENASASGPLVGDSAVRFLTSTLRNNLFGATITGQPLGVRTLSDIGINVDRDGKLSLDSSDFESILESNFDDVVRLLTSDGSDLDQNQQLTAATVDAASTVVGGGDITLTVGGDGFTVSLVAGSTLTDIRDAINDAGDNIGVTASITLVSDGGGGTDAQLILTGDTAGQSISVSVDDLDGNDDDSSGVSLLNSSNLSEVVAATSSTSVGVIQSIQAALEPFLASGDSGIIDARTDGLSAEIERIEDQRLSQQRRIEDIQTRLSRQYTSLDLLVANLQSSGDFLISQLNSISQISNFRNNNN